MNSRVRRARKKQADRRLKQLEKTGHVPDEVMPVGPIAELPEEDLALIIMDERPRGGSIAWPELSPAEFLAVSASRAVGHREVPITLNSPFFDPLGGGN